MFDTGNAWLEMPGAARIRVNANVSAPYPSTVSFLFFLMMTLNRASVKLCDAIGGVSTATAIVDSAGV